MVESRDAGGKFLPSIAPNPNGSSARARDRKHAREWITAIADNEIPETILKAIKARNPVFFGLLPPGATFGFGQALRLNLLALTGSSSEALAAIGLMEKILPDAPLEILDQAPPVLETTEEQRIAMAEALGVDPGESTLQ